MGEWRTVPVGHFVIVEGCYSLRKELAPLLDFRIWVESPKSLRLDRGIDRDGETNRHLWEDLWMPAEDRYVEAEQPQDRAELILDGSGAVRDISHNEVHVLRAPNGWYA